MNFQKIGTIFFYQTYIHMATLYTINKPRHRSKVAIIDYDWTICKPKNNKTFPTDVDDWEWLRPSVPDVIKDLYHKKGK